MAALRQRGRYRTQVHFPEGHPLYVSADYNICSQGSCDLRICHRKSSCKDLIQSVVRLLWQRRLAIPMVERVLRLVKSVKAVWLMCGRSDIACACRESFFACYWY